MGKEITQPRIEMISCDFTDCTSCGSIADSTPLPVNWCNVEYSKKEWHSSVSNTGSFEASVRKEKYFGPNHQPSGLD